MNNNLMLTTVDNPYDPKTDYDKWQQWDEDNGYYTQEYIARLASMEEGFDIDDEVKMNEIVSKVINDIIDNDIIHQYKVV